MIANKKVLEDQTHRRKRLSRFSRRGGLPGRIPTAPSFFKPALFPVEALGLEPASLSNHRGPTAHAIKEQHRRILALAKISLYVEAGYGKCRAANLSGVNYITAWRWQKLQAAGGDDALLPRRHLSGRRSQFTLRQDALSRVEAAALTTGSRRAAFLQVARGEDCPSEIAARVHPRNGYVAAALLNQIRVRRVPVTLLIGPTRFSISFRKHGKGAIL
ncbi:MAG: hypothetical protein MUF81_16750 [Verrucomicrobia bacterium]|jgi:hypothetical protein|nr:hypothetical protein [Verrucomicrobiota bacterium]